MAGSPASPKGAQARRIRCRSRAGGKGAWERRECTEAICERDLQCQAHDGVRSEQERKAKEEAQRFKPEREKLPVFQGKDAILKGIADNDTVIVLAETGSGKTTQVPQYHFRSEIPCADEPHHALDVRDGRCVVGGDARQPRRDLEAYDVVVLDEAHERSLRTDMVMGFLKGIQKRWKEQVQVWKTEQAKSKGKAEVNGVVANGEVVGKKSAEERDPTELKIVVMSVTVVAQRFSDFFDRAPVLYVAGRQHTVNAHYAEEHQPDFLQPDFLDAALETVYQIHTCYPPGSILVFLAGQEEIEGLAASIKSFLPSLQKEFPHAEELLVTPLYAKLHAAEQAKAFLPSPPRTRKVILATNIAETSVTIPGVKYVVDCGLAKEKRYHAGTGIDSLVTESISQSSAKQRTGRAGRETDGFCFRLYTEATYNGLEKRSQPEIQRVSLTFAILHLIASGQDDVFKFSFMDPPDVESIKFAILTLIGLNALGKRGKITPLGRQMAQLPLDPVYARVRVASFVEGCPREMIDLVSLVGAKDQLLINTSSTRDAANAARQKFVHRSGDHMMLLNILRAYEELDGKDEQFVRGRRGGAGLNALIGGLFANTALRQEDGSYRHTMTKQFVAIHPSSTLHGKKVPAIIYDELVLTTKMYARGVSSIEPSQIRSKALSLFGSSLK
ncbi:Salivary acidic proline-rich phosphoprotein 1/2 [Rhodotorula toruloides]